jgi:hypothetical protein
MPPWCADQVRQSGVIERAHRFFAWSGDTGKDRRLAGPDQRSFVLTEQ